MHGSTCFDHHQQSDECMLLTSLVDQRIKCWACPSVMEQNCDGTEEALKSFPSKGKVAGMNNSAKWQLKSD